MCHGGHNGTVLNLLQNTDGDKMIKVNLNHFNKTTLRTNPYVLERSIITNTTNHEHEASL